MGLLSSYRWIAYKRPLYFWYMSQPFCVKSNCLRLSYFHRQSPHFMKKTRNFCNLAQYLWQKVTEGYYYRSSHNFSNKCHSALQINKRGVWPLVSSVGIGGGKYHTLLSGISSTMIDMMDFTQVLVEAAMTGWMCSLI